MCTVTVRALLTSLVSVQVTEVFCVPLMPTLEMPVSACSSRVTVFVPVTVDVSLPFSVSYSAAGYGEESVPCVLISHCLST